MPEGEASQQAAPKKQPRKTGVPEMDATFDRIRADRKAARENLKELRKEFKKDAEGTQADLLFSVSLGKTSLGIGGSLIVERIQPRGRCSSPPLEEEAAEFVCGRCPAHRNDDGHEGRGCFSRVCKSS